MLLFIGRKLYYNNPQIGGFNTSHVTLYQFFHVKNLFYKRRFNTSHVTLYRIRLPLLGDRYAFQYISCYSLSESLTG